MLIKYIITLSISFLLTILCYASPVTIKGTAPSYIGKEISIYTYLDHFSKSLRLEDLTMVDEHGAFELTLEIDQTQLVNIRCDYINAHLYIQEGSSYDILFPTMEVGQNKSINNTTYVDVIFNDLEKDDINERIILFNHQYQLFFNDNLGLLTKIALPGAARDSTRIGNHKKSAIQLYQEKLKGFASRMDTVFPDDQTNFFHLYRKSIEADMFQNAHTTPRYIYNQYIKGIPVNIKHPEQINLLATFFEDYFIQFDEKFGIASLKNAIQEENALEKSLDILGQDDFLEDKELREVVLTYALYSQWNNNSIDQSHIISLIRDIASNGSSPTSRNLAENISLYLSRDMVGAPAYNFTVADTKGQSIQLHDYKGKYVVLEFWATWCTDCLQEMALTSRFVKDYATNFDFISISIDENSEKVTNYVQEHTELNQTILHMAKDKLILDHFNIRSLPAYIILDQEMNILTSNAPFPSKLLEQHLHKISTKKKEEKENSLFDFKPKN